MQTHHLGGGKQNHHFKWKIWQPHDLIDTCGARGEKRAVELRYRSLPHPNQTRLNFICPVTIYCFLGSIRPLNIFSYVSVDGEGQHWPGDPGEWEMGESSSISHFRLHFRMMDRGEGGKTDIWGRVSVNQGWEDYFGNVICYRLLVTLFKM